MLKQAKQNVPDPKGKFRPNWEGPYLVKTIPSRGSIKLMDFEGNEFSELINVDRLKKYYAKKKKEKRKTKKEKKKKKERKKKKSN